LAPIIATQSAQPGAAPVKADPHPADLIAARMAKDGQGAMDEMISTIEAMLGKASDLDEFRDMLMTAFPDLNTSALAKVLTMGLTAAHAAGRSDLVDESQ
jgi:hypothetical protein